MERVLQNSLHFLSISANKNCKQAAKPAEGPEPTVDPTAPAAETVTVNVEVYSGVATQTISAAEVATKLGVEDLAAAIADGTVTYVGLNADGTVYTKEDGSTPAYTTNGPCGHWYSTECNPMVWGTEGLTMLAYIEGDGASYTLGYANAAGFAEGDNYKLAGKYIMGETEVIFEVVMTGVAAPEIPAFEAPEADFTYSAELEYNTTWATCSWAMTAEDEMAVLATLGLDGDYNWEGALATAVEEGEVIVKGFKADGTLTENVITDHTGNSGYWFAPDGTVSTFGTGAMCADNFAYNAGTMCIMAGVAEAGNTYPGYYVYTAGDAQVIVKLECVVTAPPVDETEYVLQGTFEASFESSFANGYAGGTHEIDPGVAADMAAAIDYNSLAEASWVMLNADETVAGTDKFAGTDGWYGIDGPAVWADAASVVFMNGSTATSNLPLAWAYGVHPDHAQVGDVVTVKIEFRNAAAAKSVRYYVTITVVE